MSEEEEKDSLFGRLENTKKYAAVAKKMEDAMKMIGIARNELNRLSYDLNSRPNAVTGLYDAVDDMLRAADSLIERGKVNFRVACNYQEKLREDETG